MEHNPLHAMNGYHPDNGASTSSHNYDDYPASHPNQPLFNNNHPPNHHHQRQQQSQPIQQRPPQNQWSQGMQMNGQQPVPPQHRPPFSQPPWSNQIPPLSTFPNSMNAMPGFNMNFIPQQVIQEAYALSVAVSASDEPTLISKLLSSRKRGESYKEALNSLHAVGGHSASLWKDYYLDHKDRIDAWIAMCLQKDNDKSSVDLSKSASSERGHNTTVMGTAKKPSFKRESPPSVSTRVGVSAPPVKPSKKTNHPTPPLPVEQPNSRRSTINSITGPAPVFGSRLPAPNAEIKIPEPPSRSPSPPTNIIPHGRGNKYTQEDREFFINFVGWRLKQDSSLTRQDICDLLAKKAPHHTAQSWASHWSNNHDLPDKILAAARGIEQESEASDSEGEDGPANPRPNYKDITTTDESEEESGSEEEEESEDDGKPLRRWTEDDMGEKGGPFTDADNYMAAKYLASFPDFEGATSRERWAPFHDKHPRRSVKSWTEYYRRNGRVLEKLAKRIRKEESSSVPSIYTQCARPTLAPKVKRKHIESDDDHDDDDDDGVNNGRLKRGRPNAA